MEVFYWYVCSRVGQEPPDKKDGTGWNVYTGEYNKWFHSEESYYINPKRIVEKLMQELVKLVNPLSFLLHKLVKEPVLAPTGKYIPHKRLHYITHPQRSYQDVQNELAVELASLPRFTAYTNVQGEQHRVLLSAPAVGALDEGRIERIRRKSRDRFGRMIDSDIAEHSMPRETGAKKIQGQRGKPAKLADDTPPPRFDRR